MQTITDYIMKSILTTQGDLVVRGAAIPERLAAVALGQVFKSGGVGAKPAWGVPSLQYVSKAVFDFTRNSSGAEVVSGLGFTPRLILLLACDATSSNQNWSIGIDDNTVQTCVVFCNNGTDIFRDASKSVYIQRSVANLINGTVTALGADGFTMTFSLTGACVADVTGMALG